MKATSPAAPIKERMSKMTNSKWYKESGPCGDTVISTRVRLARNLDSYPFPCRISEKQQMEINQKVKDILLSDGTFNFRYIDMSELSDIEAMAMTEKRLVSPDFIKDRTAKALIISDDETISIMLGEEDHIRIQVMRPGFDLDECYKIADKVDRILDAHLNYAFDEKLGFLTECPTNLGTGLRASVMMHLPAIQSAGLLNQIMTTIAKIGLTIRGTYGEGSSPLGAMYQISNQVTLDISEESAINNLKSIATQIMEQERSYRRTLIKNPTVEDRIFRSLGTLKYARIMDTKESIGLLSDVRLGIACGLINDISLDTLNALCIDTQPANLTVMTEAASTQERDNKRTDIIRKALSIKK